MTTSNYDRLIDDLRAEFRPQRSWGAGRGVFMVVGHFVVGVAAGGWLFGLLYASRAALALSFVLACLGGIAHLVNLGKPERFWRMMARPGRSWVSRGFWGLSLFLIGAFVYLLPFWVPGAYSTDSIIGKLGYGLSVIGMLALMGYMGFVYSGSKAIPFWNSPLHPALYVVYALRGGVAVLLLAQAFGATSLASLHELLLWWIALTGIVALFFTLELHGAWTGGNAAAKRSVQELFGGRMTLAFYGGTLGLGLIVPAALLWWGLYGDASLAAMALFALASASGDFFIKYATIRAGVHLPVWTRRV